jgi:prophage antirepressor-like protein
MSELSLVNEIRPVNNSFLFSEHPVRMAIDDLGTPWFCAKDVCEAIDMLWQGTAKTLKSVPKEWQGVGKLTTPFGLQDAIYLTEPAVYRLIFRSNKPQAIDFTNWVCSDVLPSIRRQGYFGQLNATQSIALRYQKIKLLELLNTKDAFTFSSVLTSLKAVCNLLGETMPSIDSMGKPAKQMPLV